MSETSSSFSRGLSVLQAFRPGDDALGNAELAERTGLAKSTVSRLTTTLLESGFLTQAGSGRQQFRLGGAAMDMARVFLASRPLSQLAQPMLDALAIETGCAIAIAERDRLDMLYLNYARPATALALVLERGARIPLATTAAGRAWLAAAPDASRTALLGALKSRAEAAGQNWTALSDGINRAVSDYKEFGFCHSYGEWNADVNAIAIPFLSPFDGSIYVLNAGGPAFHIPPSRMETEFLPKMRDLVDGLRGSLEEEMGEAAS